MPSRAVSELIGSPVAAYLNQCRVKNDLVEHETGTHVPPSSAETKELLSYLETLGVDAVVIGSVGVLHYVKDPKAFRPTVDLDLFVPMSQAQLQKIKLPPGWTQDPESPGVTSWISPSGGYVDFMTAGHVFPSGEKTPSQVASQRGGITGKVAVPLELFRLKLNSMRNKDLSDAMTLAQDTGHLPTEKELSSGGYRLTQTQRENLELLQRWLAVRS